MFRKHLLLILSLFLAIGALAQHFGGYPPSRKWRSVENEQVRVIFPPGMEADAQRIAAIAGRLGATTQQTIGDRLRKIPIILHDRTQEANAYVGLAPWRTEFNMTPLQNSLELGSLSWTDNLVLHEFRHVQQYSNFRKGLSKAFYFFAGEEGQVFANAGAVPDWFFEGDAVLQETLGSGQGRGRLPFFFNDYRSLWQADRHYSYMKLRNGSLRDLVPDHYQLGYPLVAQGREKFGPEVWKQVTDRAVRYKPLFYPFQGAFKKVTGQRFMDFVDETLGQFRVQHAQEDPRPEPITKGEERNVTEYHLPTVIGQDSILVLKRSYRSIPWFVLISGGKEKILAGREIAWDDHYSYRHGKVVYGAYSVNARWSWEDHSDLVVLDLASRRSTRITHGTRYASPDFSHDGRSIVAVEAGPGGHSALHILDAATGQQIRVLENPDSLYFTQPRFLEGDSLIITAARRPDATMALLAVPVFGGPVRELVPWYTRAIAFPRVEGHYITFTAAAHGRDEVYLLDLRDGNLRRVLSHNTGSYEATLLPGQDSLLVAGQDIHGRLIYREAFSRDTLWQVAQTWGRPVEDLYVPKLLANGFSEVLETGRSASLPVKDYKEGGRLFNFHSWRPAYTQPEWSFSLYGNNALNTLLSTLAYTYNENEGSHKFGFDETWAGWFPHITAGMDYTFGRDAYLDNINKSVWDEVNAHLGMSIPLDLSRGNHFRTLTLSSTFYLDRILHQWPVFDYIRLHDLHYLESTISWINQAQQARRQIFPRYAQSLLVRHRVSLDSRSSTQFLAVGSLYFPGFFRDHSLVLNGAYQSRDTLFNYSYSNSFPFSRGYPKADFPRMWKWGVNYHLPLMLPDVGIGNIVYLTRVRANLFFDWTTVRSLRFQQDHALRSTGVELYFDTKWWNQQPLTFGVRYSRLMDTDIYARPPGQNQWEIILPVINIH